MHMSICEYLKVLVLEGMVVCEQHMACDSFVVKCRMTTLVSHSRMPLGEHPAAREGTPGFEPGTC